MSHYGQAPSQTPGLPFVYQPAVNRSPSRTAIPAGYPAPYGTKGLIQMPATGAFPAFGQGNPYPMQQSQGFVSHAGTYHPSGGIHHPGYAPMGIPTAQPLEQYAGIKSASEIYPSTTAFPSQGYQAQRPPFNPAFGKGGKGGKGKGKGWGAPRAEGQPIGKAANAIPLGRMRVFAPAADSLQEEPEPVSSRQTSPPRQVRVIGRGRALTVPAWAKKQAEAAPGERPRDRSPPRGHYTRGPTETEHRSHLDRPRRREGDDRQPDERTPRGETSDRNHRTPRERQEEPRSYESRTSRNDKYDREGESRRYDRSHRDDRTPRHEEGSRESRTPRDDRSYRSEYSYERKSERDERSSDRYRRERSRTPRSRKVSPERSRRRSREYGR